MTNHNGKCPSDEPNVLRSSHEECESSHEQRVDSCCRANEKEMGAPSFQKEAEEWKDKYMRAIAEIENVRKRLTREKIEGQGFAIQNVIADFIQPFDQLEVALEHADKAPQEVKMWAIGFQMILEQFKQLFLSYDVQSIPGVGTLFDPNLHEAIEVEETLEAPEGTILQLFQKGYKIGSRTIRPARVKVAAAPKTNEKEEINEQK